MEDDDDIIISFLRAALVDQLVLQRIMSEEEKRVQDAEAARNDYDREIVNWIEFKVPWTKLHSKIEFNLRPNRTRIDAHDDSWRISRKALVEYLMEENG